MHSETDRGPYSYPMANQIATAIANPWRTHSDPYPNCIGVRHRVANAPYPYPYPYPYGSQAACRGRYAPLPSKSNLPHSLPNQLQTQAIYATTDRTRAPEIANPSRTIRAMSPSALRKTGSTRQWRNLRKPLLLQLARNGYLNCAARRSPKCLIKITRPQDLVAGHVIARTHGGSDHQLQPECRPCSDHQGGQLAHQQQTAPERRW